MAVGGQANPDSGLQTMVQWGSAATGMVLLSAQINPHCIARDSLEVAVSGGVGLQEHAVDGVEIFPNPAHESVQIRSPEKMHQVLLIHINGMVLQEKVVDGNSAVLDLSEIAAGLYLLQVKKESGLTHHRLVVHR